MDDKSFDFDTILEKMVLKITGFQKFESIYNFGLKVLGQKKLPQKICGKKKEVTLKTFWGQTNILAQNICGLEETLVSKDLLDTKKLGYWNLYVKETFWSRKKLGSK